MSGIYVYRGGRAPENITHAIIDKSVRVIDEEAFENNSNLQSVVTHDKLEKIERAAFVGCDSLTHIDIQSVKILDSYALAESGLTELDCDNLEIIRDNVFENCKSLRRIIMPKVKIIEGCAFESTDLEGVEFPEVLEKIQGGNVFYGNRSLRRIVLPLKKDLFFAEDSEEEDYLYADTAFDGCDNLATVELVGGIHNTVSSLHMESWRKDMIQEINGINLTLASIPSPQKTKVIRWWMQSVHSRIEHYKTKHYIVLKEATTLLELALWKAKLEEEEEEEEDESLEATTKKVKIDVASARCQRRITSRASIVIKNILPFLELKLK